MTRRVRVLWLPAVAMTLVAEALLYLVMLSGYRPWTIPLDWHVFHSHHPLQFYVPWLLLLPFLGAAAALWSRHQGASPGEAAVAAMFPAIAAFGLALVATPLDILVDVVIQRSHTVEHSLCGMAWVLVSFVLAPGLALVLGLLGAAAWRRHAPRAGARTGQPEASRA
jgi:hypothetical protein